MSYTVDWIAKEINIPTSDLILKSGTEYNLPMQDFLAEIRRLEWEPTEGLWAPAILDHDNPKLDFAGANYAGFDEIINGYHIHITGAATRVNLLGTNNNLVDVLIVSGVSVVPGNSAGLQVINTGSGLTPEEQTKLDELHKLQGLAPGLPMKVTPTNRTVDTINLDITGDGENEVTVERNDP